ncbi:M1 family metallopeptidase [Thermoproteus tenax]|uniref:Aminopeptidase n=1 Tax=Thermoproteus tenax (strain ATCC 35583 / DSM 2078 / JCM 9277 / NBRC 100435 / Kra 1) TaxID=768679 RepID=G4RK39_THETK|nr:M1 family metallopeptidase [Thermoproteus tenax]CCC81934.1 family M1 peptidase [Thermoproteus tenax Kra 1]
MKIKRYDLDLRVKFNELAYDGSVLIDVESQEDLSIDAVGLAVRAVEVDGRPVQYKYDGSSIKVGGPVSGRVRIEFSGKVSEKLFGIYKAPYAGGYIISTQFEPTGARQFIPCVDRPDAKAPFKARVAVDGDYDVIFNTPPLRVYWEGGLKVFEFAETPPMPTYLLYLGIGKFYEARERLGNIELIFATPVKERLDDGLFALYVAKRSLEFFGSYFSYQYPLPKLHLIHVPEFAAGAMENFGAITGRETALLAGRESSELVKRRVAEVVAHEVAHQWFGDLVTLRWWGDLWLNESFATFLSYKALDAIFPEWSPWHRFLVDETMSSMVRDSLLSTHPVRVPIKSEAEAFEIFDDISYGKGASLLRMLEGYLGEDGLKRGLSLYVARRAYSNASAEDLWSDIEEATGAPVSRIMGAWVNKPGHPVLRVEGGRVRQARFTFNGDIPDAWPIPLVYRRGGEAHSLLVEGESAPFEWSEGTLLNVDGRGYYRVAYPNWRSALGAAVNDYERWSVINDAFGLLIQGSVGLEEYLALVEAVRDRPSYLMTASVAAQLGLLYQINPSLVAQTYVDYLRAQAKALEGSPRLADVKELVATRRALVDEEYAGELAPRIKEYSSLEPGLRQAVANAYAVAGERPFEVLSDLYRSLRSDEDRNRVLSAMLNTRSSGDFARAVDFLLNSGEVKKQDLHMIAVGARNPHVRDVAFSLIVPNLSSIAERIVGAFGDPGVLSRTLISMIPLVGIGHEEETERAVRGLKIKGIEMGVEASLELLKAYSRVSRLRL